jgi:hypothetical protein
VEQAVGVGRNDKDGTCARCGDLVPKEAERFFGIVSWRAGLSRTPRPGVDTQCWCWRRGDLWQPQERSSKRLKWRQLDDRPWSVELVTRRVAEDRVDGDVFEGDAKV